MRSLRNLLIGLVVLIAALAAGAYLLPRHVIVEREITIDAAPADVYAYLESLQAFTEWSPWQDRDPDMVVNFSGPETGVGNVMGMAIRCARGWQWPSGDHRRVGKRRGSHRARLRRYGHR